MSSFLKAFTNLLITFTDEVIELFPEETEFKTLKTGIKLIQKTNPRLLLEVFLNYIEEFREKISNRDVTFFMENDYENITQGDEYVQLLIARIKKYWNTLSENNKNSIWKYLDTLIKLADKC